MGKGVSEAWDEKHPDTRQTQPKRREEPESDRDRSSGSSCPKCCLQTRDCLMSEECGEAVEISNCITMCAMCISNFVSCCIELC